MAALIFHELAIGACQQEFITNGNHSSDLGQDVAEMPSWVTGEHQDSQHTTDQAHCDSRTQMMKERGKVKKGKYRGYKDRKNRDSGSSDSERGRTKEAAVAVAVAVAGV